MKTKLVLWGKDDQEAKVLVAVQLRAEDNQADVWTFHGEQATGDLHKRLLYEWREGKEMAFPESGYQHHESDLSAAGRLLPEGVHAEKPELIERAKTEWHFVVLSSKLNEVYQIELAELRENIEGIENYSSEQWDKLKLFWDKVREQMQDNNLARDHANSLKRQVNGLFSHLKDLRSAQEEDFQANSKILSDKFNKTLDEVNKRIEKGEMLHLVFEELKTIQREYRTAKLTREDRSPLWERIDGAFKAVKERRFGPSPTGNTPVDRHQNRLSGLMDAIAKMEQSIKRDQDDLNAQERKKGSTSIGQLESQLLDAKIQIIKGRMKSKETKLEDMHKTRVQVEQKLAQSKKSLEDKAAKKAAATEEKVADNAQATLDKAEYKADDTVAKAAEPEVKIEKKVEVKEPVAEVKEVAEKPAEKVEEKAEEAIAEVKEVVEKPVEKVEEKAEEAIAEVKEVVEKPVEKVEEKAEEAIAEVKEVVEKPVEKVEELAVEEIITDTEE